MNYSIRLDNGPEAAESLSRYRGSSHFTDDQRDAVIKTFEFGERRLRKEIPGLTVEYGPELKAPEIIGTDITGGKWFVIRSVCRAVRPKRRPSAS